MSRSPEAEKAEPAPAVAVAPATGGQKRGLPIEKAAQIVEKLTLPRGG